MKNLLGVMIAVFCLVLIPPQAHAAKANKASKAAQSGKERLVLMPLRVSTENQNMLGAMETALVQGLQQKYEVFAGQEVKQKVDAIFHKESAKKDCDETRCMEDIAIAFQSDLIATANVAKIEGGYLLALSIRNVMDNKAVYSNSLPCKGCDAFQVVDKLKELSGEPAAPAAAAIPEEPVAENVTATDPESALWGEVQKGNSADDYGAYLAQYPKGKYVALAKSRLNKFKNEAAAELAQQEQDAWDSANSSNGYDAYLALYPKGKYGSLAKSSMKKLQEQAAAETAQQEQSDWVSAKSSASEAGYQNYLNTFPQGRYAVLASARIAKFKKESAQVAAQTPKAGKAFRDCPDCPEMVVIPKGSFTMGSSNIAYENPAHGVAIGKAFALGKTEVTQRQWKAIMGNNPSFFKNYGDNCPVGSVSWNDAQAFIQKLNAKSGKQYRLPSEAEWEYACRAGGKHKYCGSDNSHSVAWYNKNSNDHTHPAAQKQANAFGLYDMSGNVWEWVEDSYHDTYNGAPTDGSAWSDYGDSDYGDRVLRGGSYVDTPGNVESSRRVVRYHQDYVMNFGFRVARTLP